MLEERSGKDKFSDVTLLTLLFAESRSETRRKHVKTKIWQLMLDADQSRSRLLCLLYTLHSSDPLSPHTGSQIRSGDGTRDT